MNGQRSVAKPPTWTHLVTEALKAADDFRTMRQLAETLGGTTNQISAALYHLQACKVVDAVQGTEGLFWFYRGEDGDPRVRTQTARRVEDKPRRKRVTRRKEAP